MQRNGSRQRARPAHVPLVGPFDLDHPHPLRPVPVDTLEPALVVRARAAVALILGFCAVADVQPAVILLVQIFMIDERGVSDLPATPPP